MKKYAEKYDGDCLSTTYKNNNTKLLWKCKNHQWGASYNCMNLRTKWCLLC